MYKIAVYVLVVALAIDENNAETLRAPSYEGAMKCPNHICEHVPGYPEKEINEAMENEHSLKTLLDGIVYGSGEIMESRNDVIVNQFCTVESNLIRVPRLMINVHNDPKYIVNTKLYMQYFRMEICSNKASNEPADKDRCHLIRSSCRQNYQNLSLVTYDRGAIKFNMFTLPVTCQCSTC